LKSWLLPCLFGEDAGLQFGDAAVTVGVATTDGLVEGNAFAFDHPPFVIEDHRDGNLRLAFAPAVPALQFAEGLVEKPPGGIVFKFDLHAILLLIDGLLGGNAAGVQRGQGKGQTGHPADRFPGEMMFGKEHGNP
jgi:hypothetical protein